MKWFWRHGTEPQRQQPSKYFKNLLGFSICRSVMLDTPLSLITALWSCLQSSNITEKKRKMFMATKSIFTDVLRKTIPHFLLSLLCCWCWGWEGCRRCDVVERTQQNISWFSTGNFTSLHPLVSSFRLMVPCTFATRSLGSKVLYIMKEPG